MKQNDKWPVNKGLCLVCKQPLDPFAHGNRRIHRECWDQYNKLDQFKRRERRRFYHAAALVLEIKTKQKGENGNVI